MYRSRSKGCEGYLGCTGPGARDVRGTWGVQVLEQGMRGVPGVYMSWSKGCEGYLGCTSHGARNVGGSCMGYTGHWVLGVYRPRSKGYEDYIRCTGPRQWAWGWDGRCQVDKPHSCRVFDGWFNDRCFDPWLI